MATPSKARASTLKIIPSESNSAEMPKIMLKILKMRRSLRRSKPMPRNQIPAKSASSMFHIPPNTIFHMVIKTVSST